MGDMICQRQQYRLLFIFILEHFNRSSDLFCSNLSRVLSSVQQFSSKTNRMLGRWKQKRKEINKQVDDWKVVFGFLQHMMISNESVYLFVCLSALFSISLPCFSPNGTSNDNRRLFVSKNLRMYIFVELWLICFIYSFRRRLRSVWIRRFRVRV